MWRHRDCNCNARIMTVNCADDRTLVDNGRIEQMLLLNIHTRGVIEVCASERRVGSASEREILMTARRRHHVTHYFLVVTYLLTTVIWAFNADEKNKTRTLA